MDNSNDSAMNTVWKELDKMALILAVLAILVLAIAYFVIIPWEGLRDITREFVSSIITNLIPVLLIFAFSYILLRRFQILRTRHEKETLVGNIAKKVKTELETEFNLLKTEQQRIRKHIRNFQRLINRMEDRIEKDLYKIDLLLQTLLDKIPIATMQDFKEIFQIAGKTSANAPARVASPKGDSSLSAALKKMEDSNE